jgi:hypothetical protein
VFFDRHCLDDEPRTDSRLSEELRRAIETSGFTVSFLSPSYATSDWCQFEVEQTLHEHRRRGVYPHCDLAILPVIWKFVDVERFSDKVWPRRSEADEYFRSHRWVDITSRGWQDDAFTLGETAIDLARATERFLDAWTPSWQMRFRGWRL